MAEGFAGAPAPANPEGSGAGLRQLLRQACRFPRFKKKGQGDSLRYPDPKQFQLDQVYGRVFLPKLGWIQFRNSRDVLGAPKHVTVSHNNGRWFFSIKTEREVEATVPLSTSAVGIDLGIARFATLSDGTYPEPLSSFKMHESALHRAPQAMSRKLKFSCNWKKAKARVGCLHSRIANRLACSGGSWRAGLRKAALTKR